MTEQKLTILGVFRPQISAETWQEQLQVTGNEAHTREHFEKLALIEAIVKSLDGRLEMGEFGQMQPEFPDVRNACRWDMTKDYSHSTARRSSNAKWTAFMERDRSGSQSTCISMTRNAP
jgi:hypothetical protein